jgi:hypothetical protein
MDFNSALDIIIKDLGEARSIIDDFRKYKDVPLLQIELAKSKCKSAAEIIALLKEIPMAGKETHKSTPSEPAIPVSSVAPVISPILVVPEQEVAKLKTVPEELPAKVKDIIILKEEPVVPPKRDIEKQIPVKPSAPKAKHDQKEILADRFKGGKERLSEKVKPLDPEADFTSRMMQSKIENLADAVGINDKFYFIREIFGGDSHTYTEAIGKLNTASGVSEAREILNSLTGGSGNVQAINDLLLLVKRKTGNDE